MKNSSLVILFFLFVISAKAQYSPAGNYTANKLLHLSDGNFCILGRQGDSAFVWGIENCSNQVLYQSSVYHSGGETLFQDGLETDDHAIIAVGTCNNCVSGDANPKVIMNTYSLGGALLNSAILGYSQSYCYGNAIAPAALEHRAVGMVWDDVVTVALFDEFNNLIWQQFYPHASPDTISYLHDIVQTSDGGFSFGGYSKNIQTGEQWMMIAKVDANGNLLWRKLDAFDSNERNEVFAIQNQPSGDLLLTGTFYYGATFKNNICVWNVASASGFFNQTIPLGNNNEEIGYDLQANPDGSWLLATSSSSPSASVWMGDTAKIILLDATLSPQQTYSFSFSPFDLSCKSIVPLSPDGSEFASISNLDLGYWKECLFTRKNISQCGDSSSFIIQSTPGGGVIIVPDDVADLLSVPFSSCSSQGIPNSDEDLMADCILGAVGIEEKSSFSFYPNPAAHILYFEDLPIEAEIRLYNGFMQEVKVVVNNSRVDISALSAGLYWIKVSEGKNIQLKPLVVN